ncbi:MAG: tetratricopeptide repeat protein, partial [Planctomycetales bacterium]
AYNLDDFAKAAKYYQEAVRLNSDSAIDHYQLGNIHLAKNRYARSVISYEAALRLGLESPVLHYKLASSYFNLRNYFGKVEVITAPGGTQGTISGRYYLIERAPGNKDVFRAAPPTSAIYQIAKAIEGGDKPQVDIRMLRANTYLSARRYQRAYELYEELGPLVVEQPKEDRAMYHYYCAQSSLGLGKFDEHLSHLRKAIQLDEATYGSALVEAYGVVAEKYNQLGKLDKYVEYLKLAVRESPQTASLHLKLGNALEEGKAYPEAIQQWRMVLDLESDHPQRTKLLNRIKKHSNTLAQRPADKNK